MTDPVRLSDEILSELASNITSDAEIEALGRKLGFSMADLNEYTCGNEKHLQKIRKATESMMRNWEENVDPCDQNKRVKQALHDAKMFRLSTSLFKGTSNIPDSTDRYEYSIMDNILFDRLTEYEPGRSYVLFINNFFTGKKHRKGAEVDEENIKKLFEHKGYYLHYEKDVSLSELKDCMELVKERLERGHYKNFMFIIGTHGGQTSVKPDKRVQDVVVMADEKCITIEKIVSNFHGDQISAMKDKPKVFIIQSCRGGKIQPSETSFDSLPTASNHETNDPELQPAYRPVNSDILIAYATSEGTKAYRNTTGGSWFVADLCQVIREYSHEENMLNILVRVNGLMVRREGETDDQQRIKQMPCFLCTFTRRLMLKYPTN